MKNRTLSRQTPQFRTLPGRRNGKMKCLWLASCAFVFLGLAQGAYADKGDQIAADSAVVWTTLGANENDSMPIGNGDLAANVWTEKNGDLVILIAKSDAWSETGDLLKLGRVRIHFPANPFDLTKFSQTLHIVDGSIVLADGANSVRIWADANSPVIHTEISLAVPAKAEASVELWRNRQSHGVGADTVLPSSSGQLRWVHFNASSDYPNIAKKEHVDALLPKYPDPLLGRAFGGALISSEMTAVDDGHLAATAPQSKYRIDIVALTKKDAGSVASWNTSLSQKISENAADIGAAWRAHEAWWKEFWNRSWISVSGTEEAKLVSQGYTIQRYMIASSSRGEFPAKFNGGLFTVGHDLGPSKSSTKEDHNPDYRAWGGNYWNQNNRLLYWPLIASGDYDLLRPWFNMYLNALPLAVDRNRLYHGHDGASFPETMYFFGLPRLGDFGTNNPTNVIQSNWQRYHVQGGIEMVAQMLDYFQYSGDAEFAQGKLVPFADAIVTYYDQHWPRDNKGRVQMSPAQSLETYQLVAVNPTPDLAGLMAVLPRMLALPKAMATEQQREKWKKLLADLPPLPTGTTTAAGKTPPFGQGDPAGKAVILPAERYGRTGNSENPELYVAFPYRLYGVGKPDLELARNTFAARRSPANTCWGQDGTQSAVLGLTDVAKKAAVAEFTNFGEQRFKWFWRPDHDWIPDLDNGGSGMTTLQLMLLQTDERRIQLIPAWPKEWTADFKLHAPYRTTVEGAVENGKVKNLKVTPAERKKETVTNVNW